MAYASWIAGSLSEAARTLDEALALCGRRPDDGRGPRLRLPARARLSGIADRPRLHGRARGGPPRLRPRDRAGPRARRPRDAVRRSREPRAARGRGRGDRGGARATPRWASRSPSGRQRRSTSSPARRPPPWRQAGAGRFADALAQAEANLATIREHAIGLYYEPMLLATIARSQLALGRPGDALAAAEEAVAIMDARGLTTCALPAPIALAQVLIATQGAAAGERIEAVLRARDARRGGRAARASSSRRSIASSRRSPGCEATTSRRGASMPRRNGSSSRSGRRPRRRPRARGSESPELSGGRTPTVASAAVDWARERGIAATNSDAIDVFGRAADGTLTQKAASIVTLSRMGTGEGDHPRG